MSRAAGRSGEPRKVEISASDAARFAGGGAKIVEPARRWFDGTAISSATPTKTVSGANARHDPMPEARFQGPTRAVTGGLFAQAPEFHERSAGAFPRTSRCLRMVENEWVRGVSGGSLNPRIRGMPRAGLEPAASRSSVLHSPKLSYRGDPAIRTQYRYIGTAPGSIKVNARARVLSREIGFSAGGSYLRASAM